MLRITETHSHKGAQLIYATAGTFKLDIMDKLFLVPPTHAIWIRKRIPNC